MRTSIFCIDLLLLQEDQLLHKWSSAQLAGFKPAPELVLAVADFVHNPISSSSTFPCHTNSRNISIAPLGHH